MTAIKPVLKMLVAAILLLFTLSHAVSSAAQAPLPKVTKIKTDSVIPGQVQALWRNGFEPCTEKGIDTSKALNGLKIEFDGDPVGSALFILACGGPGYNRPYVAIAFDGQRQIPQRVAFPEVDTSGPGARFVISNMAWNNEKMQLSAFGKDRGGGDCGTQSIWQWAFAQFDSYFVLINQKTKIDCNGMTDDFPTVWPPANWPPEILKNR